ncbi:hypothetical protein D3C77_749980 [compost metagenome]
MQGAQQGAGHLVARAAEHPPHLALLHHLARLQHHHTVAQLADHFHLVGNQHDGQVQAPVDIA